jgi:hypothetical protein
MTKRILSTLTYISYNNLIITQHLVSTFHTPTISINSNFAPHAFDKNPDPPKVTPKCGSFLSTTCRWAEKQRILGEKVFHVETKCCVCQLICPVIKRDNKPKLVISIIIEQEPI